MAQANLELVISAKDKTSAAFKKLGGSLNSLHSGLKKIGLGTIAAAGGLIYLGKKALNSYQETELIETKLNNILKTSTKATDAQVESLKQQASALQKVGVVSDDVIMAAQAQFATFDLTTDSISKLIPKYIDVVVAEKVYNDSADDMIGYSNAFGMALQGNWASLTKRGFKLDEDTKKMIENGTQAQRVEALIKVLGTTYGSLNEDLRKTSEGGMKGLMMSLDDFMKKIGNIIAKFIDPLVKRLNNELIPAIEKWIEVQGGVEGIVEKIRKWWEENGKLVLKILAVVAGVLALNVVLGVVAGIITSLIVIFGSILSPILLVGAAIVLFAILMYLNFKLVYEHLVSLYKWWKEIFDKIWTTITDFTTNVFAAIGNFILSTIEFFKQLPLKIVYILSYLVGYIIGWFIALPGRILEGITAFVKFVIDTISNLITTIVNFFKGLPQKLIDTYNTLKADIPIYWEEIKKAFFAKVEEIIQGVKDKFTGLLDAVKAIWEEIKGLWDKAKEANNAIGDKVKSVGGKVLDAFKKGVSAGVKAGKGKASGGFVSGNQGYLVGENGPELFKPSTPGQIIPNNNTFNFGSFTFNNKADISDFFDELQRRMGAKVQNAKLGI